MYKKLISINLLVLFLLFATTELSAQKKRSKKRPSKEETEENTRSRSSRDDTETISFADRINYDINIGNISLSNGFGISLKPGAAYKFTERLSAGLAVRAFYQFQNVRGGDDNSFFSYGPSLYSRFKISNEFYVQGEYSRMSYDAGPNADRVTASSPMAGVGYLSGYGPWTFGIQLLFVFDERFRDIEDTIDYWFSFSYNF